MRISINHALAAAFLIGVLYCGPVNSQVPDANKIGGARPNATPAKSAAQSVSPAGRSRPEETYVIGKDDMLSISVWKEPDLTKQIPVRSDGMISLPLIGEVQAAGRTPPQLEADITAKLQGFITEPQVSVIVQEIRSLKFNILGQVTKAGAYPLTAGMTIVDAIAVAGGFRDFAKKKGIYVLRDNGSGAEDRLAFNYKDFIKGKDAKQNIVLEPRDTIVVP